MWDTDTCIYAMKGHSGIRQRYREKRREQMYISSISAAELYYGAYKSAKVDKNLEALALFFNSFTVLPFDTDAARRYGELRVQLLPQPIRPLDTQIAAHALAEDMILVTHNVKEFSRVPKLAIEDWF